MTTLEQLVATWVYVFVTCENPRHSGYIQRPGFLISDRISIDQMTLPVGCLYGPDDNADGYESAGWFVVLMGRLIAKAESLEVALMAANALDALVQQEAIHGAMKMHGDEMYIEFDDATQAAMFAAVEKALAA